MLSRNQVKWMLKTVQTAADSWMSTAEAVAFICCLVLKRNYANINWSSGSQCWSSESFQSEFNKTQWLCMLFLFSSESSAGLANLLRDDVEWAEKLIRWVFLGVILKCYISKYRYDLRICKKKKKKHSSFPNSNFGSFFHERMKVVVILTRLLRPTADRRTLLPRLHRCWSWDKACTSWPLFTCRRRMKCWEPGLDLKIRTLINLENSTWLSYTLFKCWHLITRNICIYILFLYILYIPLHRGTAISVPIISAICSKSFQQRRDQFPSWLLPHFSSILFYLSVLQAVYDLMSCDALAKLVSISFIWIRNDRPQSKSHKLLMIVIIR